jgi:DNA repair protein RecN (Recombination protein N)
VFDEVDSGIGGAAAAAVGDRLARLSQGRQLLVVTHSPQVAARADHHFRVAKASDGEATVTDVSQLSEQERREEIARMLSGTHVTDEARAAAAKLMGAA